MTDDAHGGNVWKFARDYGFDAGVVLDFSASLNPLGPPPEVAQLLARSESLLGHYPEPYSESLREALAEYYGIKADAVLAGNGSNELLHLLGAGLKPRRVAMPAPSFSGYETMARRQEADLRFVRLDDERAFAFDLEALLAQAPDTDLMFLGHPNSPTGSMLPAAELEALLSACEASDTTLLLDAVFIDFVSGWNVTELARRAAQSKRFLLLHSFTKTFAIPGVRLGYVIGAPEAVTELRRFQPAWSVNTLAQHLGLELIGQAEFIERSRLYVTQERQRLMTHLQSLPGLSPLPSHANFLLVKLEDGILNAKRLCRALAARGIQVRDCSNVRGLNERYVRIAVRRRQENERLLAVLDDVLKGNG